MKSCGKMAVTMLIVVAMTALFATGCSRQGNMDLRTEIYDLMYKVGGKWQWSDDDLMITVKRWHYYNGLTITVYNKRTSDELCLSDYGIRWGLESWIMRNYYRGVDEASFNGYSNGLEGMDERFDEVLRFIRPHLRKHLQDSVISAKENTKLKLPE